jgi:hypothetical protein
MSYFFLLSILRCQCLGLFNVDEEMNGDWKKNENGLKKGCRFLIEVCPGICMGKLRNITKNVCQNILCSDRAACWASLFSPLPWIVLRNGWWVPKVSCLRMNGRGMMLTTDLRVVLRSRMNGTITPFPLQTLWCGEGQVYVVYIYVTAWLTVWTIKNANTAPSLLEV